MKVLDVFSCVGCHHIGLQRAGGFKTVGFCELNPWRREVLSRNFKGLKIHEDIKTIEPPKADLIFGGPPCKNTSVAAAKSGNRTGFTLWPEMFKCGIKARAKWFVVEQPPGNSAWEEKVNEDLSRAGFHVARLEFGAHDIGAPYPRRRVYIIASTDRKRLEIAWTKRSRAIDRVKRSAISRGDWDPNSIPSFGMDTWRSEQPDIRRERISALGDSNPPAMAEVIGLMLSGLYP